jgi:hypothetical protein
MNEILKIVLSTFRSALIARDRIVAAIRRGSYQTAWLGKPLLVQRRALHAPSGPAADVYQLIVHPVANAAPTKSRHLPTSNDLPNSSEPPRRISSPSDRSR